MMQRGLYVACAVLAGYALFGAFTALGFAAVAVNFFTPLPAAYVGMRFSAAAGFITVAMTALLVLVTSDQNPALMYLVQFGVPGAALPWLLRRGVAWDKATVIVLWMMVVVTLCGLFAVAAGSGQSPFAVSGELIGKEVSRTSVAMQEVFAEADMPAAQRADVEIALGKMAEFLLRAYPGISIAVGGLMVLCLVFLLSVLTLGRYVVPGKDFQLWKAPEILVWPLILSGFLLFFTEGLPETVALNLLVILLPVYFLQGLAVIDCFFRRKAFSPLFRAVGYLLVTLVNPLPMVVTGLGVFDLWADFRKPRRPES